MLLVPLRCFLTNSILYYQNDLIRDNNDGKTYWQVQAIKLIAYKATTVDYETKQDVWKVFTSPVC